MEVDEIKGRVDFGIITIREDEFEAVLDRFPEDLGIVSGRRQYNIRRIAADDPYTVAIVRCAVQANSEAQQVANALLDELEPRWLLVVGIGGGAPAFEFTLGDVVVATEVCDFNVGAVLKDGSREYALHGWMSHPDVAKHAANLPAMRKQLGAWNSTASVHCERPTVTVSPKAVYGGAKWKKKIMEVMQHHLSEGRQVPKVTAGAIACSDLVVKDAELLKVWLKFARQVIAVEMESAGVHKAAQDRHVPFMSIRGLSDIVGFNRDPKWTRYACHTAAAFTRAFLLTRPIRPRTSGERSEHEPEPAKPLAEPPPAHALPPPPQRFVGRDDLAAQLTAAILREPAPSIVALGPGGIGKSTLTLEALHRAEVAGRFGARRWFVRLDAAPNADAAVGLIVAALGLPPQANPLAGVRAFLSEAPGVLALDNLETPWEGNQDATDTLLRELAAIPGLVLVASVRGEQGPAGVAWQETIPVPRLKEDPAAELFCKIARAKRDDPALGALLARLEGVPLAITLLAHVAEGVSLAGILDEWEKKRTALLAKEGAKPGRETSWAASMALSVESPRMTTDAKRLLALLGRLPDGVAFVDVDALLPGKGSEAKRRLVQVGLAYEEGERLRLLAPVREYVRDEVPVQGKVQRKDLARAMAHYGDLAQALAPMLGTVSAAGAIARLAPETANLDAMVREGLNGGTPERWIRTAVELGEVAVFSGRTSPSPLTVARTKARTLGATRDEANCVQCLGSLALDRSDYGAARRLIEDALLLHRQAGDFLGEANCNWKLGDIAFRQSDHETARRLLEEARRQYRLVGDVRGEAHCTRALSDFAFRAMDHETARRLLNDALPLYGRVGDVLGQANCMLGLSVVAVQKGDHAPQDIYALIEKARAGYRRVGDVLGEANCIRSIGDVAISCSDLDTARDAYTHALTLYALIPQPHSMGIIHSDLARLATNSGERERHLASARTLWTHINLPHLVAALDAEFSPPATPSPQSSPSKPSPPAPPDPPST